MQRKSLDSEIVDGGHEERRFSVGYLLKINDFDVGIILTLFLWLSVLKNNILYCHQLQLALLKYFKELSSCMVGNGD